MILSRLISVADIGDSEQIKFFVKKSLSFADSISGLAPFRSSANKVTQPIGLIFLEPSTRTRVSFERAAQILGRPTVLLENKGSSFEKGESLEDTLWTLNALGVKTFVIRTPQSSGLEPLAKESFGSIVNAGDGINEHPTQALLDLCTLVKAQGSPYDLTKLSGFRLGIMGDIAHSRVAHSWSLLAPRVGIELSFLGPDAWRPKNWGQKIPWISVKSEFMKGLNAVMALRVQKERLEGLEIDSLSQNLELLKNGLGLKLSDFKQGQWLLSPGPTNWGWELDSELQHCTFSLIREQVRMGLAVRSALLDCIENG